MALERVAGHLIADIKEGLIGYPKDWGKKISSGGRKKRLQFSGRWVSGNSLIR
ncbi:MAG: hypothetical protein V3U48_03090 [Rhodospirillales bacterium]